MKTNPLANLAMVMLLLLTACGVRTPPRAGEDRLRVGLEAYERGDYAGALKNLEPLAKNGDAAAQSKLGYMYYLGLGVPEDNREAAKWFGRAADQCDLEAQINLATLYLLGAGVEQDLTQAARLLHPPAERGISGAQFMLGMVYLYGKGVARDPVKAYMWLELAAMRGSRSAAQARTELAAGLTPEQIDRARALVHEWRPRRSCEK